MLELRDVPRPQCGPLDLLVEGHASAMNPVDTKLRRFGRAGLVAPPRPDAPPVTMTVLPLSSTRRFYQAVLTT